MGTAVPSYFPNAPWALLEVPDEPWGLLRDARCPWAAGLDSPGLAYRRQPEQAQCLSPAEPWAASPEPRRGLCARLVPATRPLADELYYVLLSWLVCLKALP